MKPYFIAVVMLLSSFAVTQQPTATIEPKTIFGNAKAATVVILSGEGAGRLHSIATGVIVSKEGVIFTAYHALKGAEEVQVRLSSGDVYDQVSLLGYDERRDVAAIKIAAGSLPTLPIGNSASDSQGDPVYAVTNADGLTWSATEGILSAIRPADEVPGAGSGYHLIQFTAPVAPGSSGGALVDKSGALIGIITRGNGTAGFAVPIESVSGLAQMNRATPLGSGAHLQMPSKMAADVPQSSAAVAGTDPTAILRNAKTIFVTSRTSFLTVDTVDRALLKNKDWPKLGLTLVQDSRVADLVLTFDRPLFTYVHTFVLTDKKTSIILASGKVTAFDGTTASGRLAADIVKVFLKAKAEGSTTKTPTGSEGEAKK